jgi:eukaryotic-like serine/threonine-protein kinase
VLDPLIGKRVGNYQIVSLLGKGGMACVYRATHPEIGRDVAIKVLSSEVAAMPDVVRRFRVEAQAVNKIEHPNIIRIFDFGQLDDGRSFCVMELLSGENLADHIRRVGAMSLHDALAVVDAVLDALEIVHRANIVHRDLKPDNVFLARTAGRTLVKVLDFGIVKLLDDGAFDKTRTGSLLGTPGYMAPEQCEGRQRDVGPKTDLYAVGCMLYQMLSGQLPFDADSLGGLLLQHMTQTPPRLTERIPNVPEPISGIVASCLAKDLHDRPESAVHLRTQLRPYLAPATAETLASVQPSHSAATIVAPVQMPPPLPSSSTSPGPVAPPRMTMPFDPTPMAMQPTQPAPARSRPLLAIAGGGGIVGAIAAIVLVVHGGHSAAPAGVRPIDAATPDAARPDAPIDAAPPDAAIDAPVIDAPPDGPLTLKQRLQRLNRLCADRLLTPDECVAKRLEILDQFNP